MPGADLDVLEGSHLVERHRARPGDGAAGFDREGRGRQARERGLVADDVVELRREIGDRRRVVARHVRDAEAAAEVDDVHLRGLVDAELGDDVAQQTDDAVGGQFEAVDVEDLRADVAVQADEAEIVGREDAPHGLHGVAAGEREPELLVLVRGGDELVGVGLDAHGHADEHVLDDTGLTGDRVEPVDLGERVEHDVPDPGGHGGLQFADGLVVAVHRDLPGGEAGVQGHGELTTGRDVERESFLMDPPRDLAAQERLRRVVHLRRRTEGLRDLPAAGAEVVLVDDEQRGAVLLGELGHRDAGDAHDAVLAARRVARPTRRERAR